jgi:hypothetical protein
MRVEEHGERSCWAACERRWRGQPAAKAQLRGRDRVLGTHRMSHHYVGKVFLFQRSPSQEENVVDIPITSQSENAPLAAIVQLPQRELSSRSKERMQGVSSQTALRLATIQENKGIDPLRQIRVAEEMRSRPAHYHRLLAWTSVPCGCRELGQVCRPARTRERGRRPVT